MALRAQTSELQPSNFYVKGFGYLKPTYLGTLTRRVGQNAIGHSPKQGSGSVRKRRIEPLMAVGSAAWGSQVCFDFNSLELR